MQALDYQIAAQLRATKPEFASPPEIKAARMNQWLRDVIAVAQARAIGDPHFDRADFYTLCDAHLN